MRTLHLTRKKQDNCLPLLSDLSSRGRSFALWARYCVAHSTLAQAKGKKTSATLPLLAAASPRLRASKRNRHAEHEGLCSPLAEKAVI